VVHWCIGCPLIARAGAPVPSPRAVQATSRRARRSAGPLVLVLVAVLAGCAPSVAHPEDGAGPTSTGTTGVRPSTSQTVEPGTATSSTTATVGTTAAPPWSPTTLATPSLVPSVAPCPGGAGAHDRVSATTPSPTPTGKAVTAAIAELQRSGGIVSVAVSDVGRDLAAAPTESVTVNPLAVAEPERRMVPASNQKLLIAAAVLEAVGPEATFRTTVIATGPTVDGVVQGDLVLVGGGDPTLTKTAGSPGPTSANGSLEALAGQVRARGIVGVTGRVLIDERRFDQVRFGAGGSNGNLGPMSALVVDRNRAFDTPTFAADPAASHGAAFAALLQAAGVSGPALGQVATIDPTGPAVAGTEVAAVASPPMRTIVGLMLERSDNMYAELLAKDLGFRTGGSGQGTTAGGLAAARRIVAGLCVTLDGRDSDASGLSLANLRTTGSLQRLLEVAMTRPWWPAFRDGMAVAGRTGTLAGRMTNGPAAGRVRAKSGSVGHARALSGYVPTAGGHTLVFSVLVDNATTETEKAIDAFATTLVAAP
jgi:D-alanyl-D-alanine carboxypeptidase/D-alanyl-D-alanine-endopeptidase (penicillin-binding protein 4)